jgi:predicted small lipoprotein YifL
MSTMRRRSGSAVVAMAMLALAACGVQSDAQPRDLPDIERTIEIADDSADIDASGADRVYFVGPGEERLLRSVQRDAVSVSDLVEILLLGPNADEVQAEFNTAIPSGTELINARTQGQVLTVNLTPEILELDRQNLTRAAAQIVYTATELDGIEAVQIEVDNVRLSAPTGDGDDTTEPLRTYDYPGLLETSQPAFPAAAVSASA